jgi:hypothetical protein
VASTHQKERIKIYCNSDFEFTPLVGITFNITKRITPNIIAVTNSFNDVGIFTTAESLLMVALYLTLSSEYSIE